MSDNTKSYKIKINGLEESIKLVDALIVELDNLEKQIDSVGKKTLNIQVSSSVTTSQSTTSTPIDTANDAEYNRLLAERERLLQAVNKELANTGLNVREYRQQTKELVAEETKARNEAQGYENTLNGLKKELKDLNSTKGNLDLGSKEYADTSKRIKEVTDKLKELEAAQGSFGRNVGNYGQVAEDLKKISVSIGDDEVAFNNAREASREFNNELNALGAQMYELEKEGKTSSEEFKNLEARFREVAQGGDELNHVIEYTNRLKQSIQDDSGAVGELARSFEAFNSVVQVGLGISGLFGTKAEEIQKSLNRTVQVMTVLKGVQELVNTQFQKGAPLMKLWTASNVAATAVMKSLGIAINSTSIAVKGLRAALASTGIGLLIVAVGALVNGIMNLIEKTMNQKSAQEKLNEQFEKGRDLTRAYLSELQSLNQLRVDLGLITNAQAASENFKKANEDFKNLAKNIKNSGVQIRRDYQKMFEFDTDNMKNSIKDILAWLSNMATQYEADKAALERYNSELEKASGKHREYILTMIAQTQAQIEAYEGLKNLAELYAKINQATTTKTSGSSTKSAVNDAKEREKKLKEIEKKIVDNKIAAMKEGLQKEIAQLEVNRKREIAEAEETAKELKLSAEKKNELIQSIEDKYASERLKKEKENAEKILKVRESVNDMLSSVSDNYQKLFDENISLYLKDVERNISQLKELTEDTISPLQKFYTLTSKPLKGFDKIDTSSFKEFGNSIVNNTKIAFENVKTIISNIGDKIKDLPREWKQYFSGKEMTDRLISNLYSTETTIDEISKEIKVKLEETYGSAVESLNRTTLKANTELVNELETNVNSLKSTMEEVKGSMKDLYDSVLGFAQSYHREQFNIEKNGIEYQTRFIDREMQMRQQLYQDALKQWKDIETKFKNGEIDKVQFNKYREAYEGLIGLYETFDKTMFLSTVNHQYKMAQLDDEYFDRQREATKAQNNLIIESYKKQYEEIEQLRSYYNQPIRTTNWDVDDLGNWIQKNAEMSKFKNAYSELYKNIQKEIDKNNEAIDAKKRELVILEDELRVKEELLEESNKLNLTEEERTKQAEKLQNQIQKQEARQSELKAAIEQSKEALVAYRTELDGVKLDNGDVDVQLFDKEKAIADTEEAIQKMQQELDTLNVDKLKEQLNQLTIPTKQIEGEVDELKQKIQKKKLELFDLKQANKDLGDFGSQVKMMLDGLLKDWKAWAKNIASIAQTVVNIWSEMYSQIIEMQYNNEMYRIEQEEKALEEEYDLLEKELEKQEELYDKHNSAINDIEENLKDARGDRRIFLLDQLGAEINAREQAWATEQKIQRQKEENEKKQQQLEKQKEAAEKKRNQAQKKVQIAQATVNTAVAVTNALAVQPWFLGVALAAVAAAMGAVQIATIAKTKYASGGLIDGKPHSQGGVKVEGTNIELEGQEFVINKKTTEKNLPLIEYINETKRKLTLSDFEAYFSNPNARSSKPSKTRFASGGQLETLTVPQLNIPQLTSAVQTDDRPIYVAVTEIEDAQARVRNVRVLAGEQAN